jgi:hypothetical protein
VAAPVWDHRVQVTAALGLAGPAYRLTDERLYELSEEVVEAATAISVDLGARRDDLLARRDRLAGAARPPLAEVT